MACLSISSIVLMCTPPQLVNGELALGALDGVELNSSDTLGFWDATHFALFPLRQQCIVGLREP